MSKAVIFDMDGVIINSEVLYDEAFRKLVNLEGKELSQEHLNAVRGMEDIEIWKNLIDWYELKESPEYYNERILEDIMVVFEKDPEISAIDGLLTLLEGLKVKGLRLSVASSADLNRIKVIVERLEIRDYFEFLTSADEVSRAKPSPEIYLKAAEKMDLSPSECWVIEDSTNGVKAAKGAGMKCIGFRGPYDTEQDHSLADKQVIEHKEINLDWFVD